MLVDPAASGQVFYSTSGLNDANQIAADTALMAELGLGGASVALASSLTSAKIEDPFANEADLFALSYKQVNKVFLYNLAILALVYFEMLEVPFRIAFSPEYPNNYLVCAAIIDWIFIVDFAVRFYLPYLHKHGHYVRGPTSQIAGHYFRTWCIPNAIAAIPWDFFLVCIFQSSPVMGSTLVWMKFCRLTRVARMPEIFTRISEWEVSLSFDISPIVYRASRIVLGVVLWLLTSGCIFWLIAASERLPWSWSVYDDAAFNPTAQDVWVQYLTSTYWVLVTFSTVGYGDIGGSTWGERGFIIFFALLSIGVTAFATGNVVTWLQSAEAKRTVLADKLDEVKSYIQYRQIDADLASKMLRFHRFRGLNIVFEKMDAEVLSEVSPALRFKICRHFRHTIFRNWGLALICDTLFLTSMVMRMRRETRYPGEIIALQGTAATRFYILTSGYAVVVKDGMDVMEIMAEVGGSPGCCFGEMALFADGVKRTSTLRAIESCELLYLKRKDIVYLLSKFPEHRARVEEYGANLRRQLQEDAQSVIATMVGDREKEKASKKRLGIFPRRGSESQDQDLQPEQAVPTVRKSELALADKYADQALSRRFNDYLVGEAVGTPSVPRMQTVASPEDLEDDEELVTPNNPVVFSEKEKEEVVDQDVKFVATLAAEKVSEELAVPVAPVVGDEQLPTVVAATAVDASSPVLMKVPLAAAPEASAAVAVPPVAAVAPKSPRLPGLLARSPREAGVAPERKAAQVAKLSLGGGDKSPRGPRAAIGGGGGKSPRMGNKSPRMGDKSPRLGGGGSPRQGRGRATSQDNEVVTVGEVDERLKDLPRIPNRLFKQSILNDPSAVAKAVRNEYGVGAVVVARELVSWLVRTYALSRADAVYVGQRLLRHRSLYAAQHHGDFTDDETPYKLLDEFLTKEKLADLLDTDVVGGVVTSKMKYMIQASAGSAPSAPPRSQSPMHQSAPAVSPREAMRATGQTPVRAANGPLNMSRKDNATKEDLSRKTRGETVMNPSFNVEAEEFFRTHGEETSSEEQQDSGPED